MFFIAEVILKEAQIVQIHCQTQFIQQRFQRGAVHADKAIHRSNRGRHSIISDQRLRLFHRCLAAFHGVDDILLNLGHSLLIQSAKQHVHLSRADNRALPSRHQLNALAGRIRALVKLTGQRLHSEHDCIRLGNVFGGIIYLGFREDRLHSPLEQLRIIHFHIIAVQQANGFQFTDTQYALQLLQQAGSLMTQAFLFFYIYTVNHGVYSS